MLNGNLLPTSGTVHYKGQDITRLPLHRRAHIGIGRSFQITNIFPNLTLFENVRLSAQASGQDNFKFWQHYRHFKIYEEAAREAIEQVHLTGKEYLVANQLSHGDKRKLELAILIAGRPELLLLDEPTAGMSTEQVPELMATIQEIKASGEKTIMLVEHNMNVVMGYSDYITVMHLGAVLAEGRPEEIAKNEIVQQAYLGEYMGIADNGSKP
jgi:branched-chain amino acid transport system ATP-binding protein